MAFLVKFMILNLFINFVKNNLNKPNYYSTTGRLEGDDEHQLIGVEPLQQQKWRNQKRIDEVKLLMCF